MGLSKNAVNAKLVKSETAAQNSVQHNAMSIQWKDKREVRMLTFCKSEKIMTFDHVERKRQETV